MFCSHAAADRGGIGYHSLTPNTFTADTMINEPGAMLQGLFLDPLDPLLTTQLPLTPPPPPHQCWTPSIWTKPTWGYPGWDVWTILMCTNTNRICANTGILEHMQHKWLYIFRYCGYVSTKTHNATQTNTFG